MYTNTLYITNIVVFLTAFSISVSLLSFTTLLREVRGQRMPCRHF